VLLLVHVDLLWNVHLMRIDHVILTQMKGSHTLSVGVARVTRLSHQKLVLSLRLKAMASMKTVGTCSSSLSWQSYRLHMQFLFDSVE
jgi:hypothetical protein